MKKKSTVSSLVLIIILASLFTGCEKAEKPDYFFDTVAGRAKSLVKFEREIIDYYDYRLEAKWETAIDVSNADTAQRILFTEIDYPAVEKDTLFLTAVDLVNYEYFPNSIRNFLRQAPKVEIPMFSDVNNRLKLTFLSDSGLTLMDSASGKYFIPLREIDRFLAFIEGLPDLAALSEPLEISSKKAYIDSVIAGQSGKLERKYTFKRLKVFSPTYKIAGRDSRSDDVQVNCIFTVSNPNAFDCVFDATVILEGKKGGRIHSFIAVDEIVAAGKSQQFVASCVLKSFQAERIGGVLVEISRQNSKDPKFIKYGK